MLSHKILRRHAALVDRMASAMDVDLEEAVLRGHLTADALPDMVLRCTGCANPDGCTTFLEQAEAHGGGTAVPTTPYYCRNAEVFDDLGRH